MGKRTEQKGHSLLEGLKSCVEKLKSCVEKLCAWLEGHKLCAGSLIIFLGFVVGVCIALWLHSLTGVGIMGIWILAMVLIGANILSEERSLTTGEVRKAIAISCISVFFGVLAFGETIKTDNDILKAILENFWWIIVTVIGFYFGGRSAEKIVESLKDESRENKAKNDSKEDR